MAFWNRKKPKPVHERIAPVMPVMQSRTYRAAQQSRLTSDWIAYDSSSDSELHTSLMRLRAFSRALVRDNAYATRARNIVVNNVIGSGIGMQAAMVNNRGRSVDEINDAIEQAWYDWTRADRCHTGGRLHFSDLERLAMGEIFESGEVLIRKHRQPFGDSRIPLALEIIEAERLADDYSVPAAEETRNVIRMGVEVDSFGRPVAYWLRDAHPNEYRQTLTAAQTIRRVPADQIIHLHLVDRWPQSRGVPWLHAAIRRLQDVQGYSDAEIVAARASACIMGFIESPEPPAPDATEDNRQMLELEPGTVRHLLPGETFNGFNPQRQAGQMDVFIRFLIREIACGAGTSYESLSRDYSQSNYSSSRLSLIDDRDNWRSLQQWFIRSFREIIHAEWLDAAVLSGSLPAIPIAQYAVNPDRYRAVSFKPRGWSWVDPTKEVEAYREAVKAGFMTITDVIAMTGNGLDIEDVVKTRRRELDLMEEHEVYSDLTVVDPEDMMEQTSTGSEVSENETEQAEEDSPENSDARMARSIRLKLAK